MLSLSLSLLALVRRLVLRLILRLVLLILVLIRPRVLGMDGRTAPVLLLLLRRVIRIRKRRHVWRRRVRSVLRLVPLLVLVLMLLPRRLCLLVRLWRTRTGVSAPSSGATLCRRAVRGRVVLLLPVRALRLLLL